MKNLSIVILVGSTLSFALPALAQQTDTPDPQLRQELLLLAKKFQDACNSNDATALAALYTKDAVEVTDQGPIHGREAIEKHFADLFKNVRFSDDHTTYNDPTSPHSIGTSGNEMWENGEWTITYQVKGSDPVPIKGYSASIAVREDGVWKKRMVVTIVTPAPAK